jgi:transposase
MPVNRVPNIVLAVAQLFFRATPASPQGPQSFLDWATFHARDVRNASKKFGISTGIIEKLIHATDREGSEEDQYIIQRIDASSLKQRSHVLLALTDFGTANFLEVNVIDVKTSNYAKVWSTREIPEWSSCPFMDLSTESMLGIATASAQPNGTIVIKIPIRGEKPTLLIATFAWSGETYKLTGEREFLQYKGNASDWETQGAGRIRTCTQK